MEIELDWIKTGRKFITIGLNKNKDKQMTQKELQDTVIVTGWRSAYIAKKSKNKTLMSEIRREIVENEILGLIVWYSQQKFENDDCDEYTITDSEGNIELTIKKGENKQ